MSLYLWWLSGLLCWWIFIVPEVVLNLAYLSIFQGWLHWWVLMLRETYDHWSVAVLAVTVHSSFVPTLHFFKKVCCFLHWIQSVNPHFYVALYYNGCPCICLMSHSVCWQRVGIEHFENKIIIQSWPSENEIEREILQSRVQKTCALQECHRHEALANDYRSILSSLCGYF